MVQANSEISALVGSIEDALSSKPTAPCSELAIEMLTELSRTILSHRQSRNKGELVSLGYWMRKSNLIRLDESFNDGIFRVGLGTILHIAPENVPLNFAYSLCVGLLSGNSNIVRLPTRNTQETEMFIEYLNSVLEKLKGEEVSRRVCLVRYSSSSSITEDLSRQVDGRIIWGGDETVQRIRKLATKPRAVDVAMGDKSSMCILDLQTIGDLDDKTLSSVAERFVRDSLTYGQNACSSPRLVVWIGTDLEKRSGQSRFWSAVDSLIGAENARNPIDIIDRFVAISTFSAQCNTGANFTDFRRPTVRAHVPEFSSWTRFNWLRNGTFMELDVSKIDEVHKFLTPQVQTVSYFGFDSDILRKSFKKTGVIGVDRVVPLGTALDFDNVWDGYDLIRTLTRVIQFK